MNEHGEWFERIFEGLPDAVILTGQDQRIALVNRHAEEIFGYARTELVGQPIDILIPERLRNHHAELAAGFIAAPQARSMGQGREILGVRKDGAEIPIEIGLNSLETPAGIFAVASIIDISERRRAEEAQQQMAALVESAEDAILTKNLWGIVRSWNPGAERLLGYRADEIVGRPITLLIPDDRQSEETVILDSIRSGRRVAHFETVRRCKDGTLIDVSLTVSPVLDRYGAIVGASKIMRDISPRKRAENELRRSNAELARTNRELDDFVYTASHDLRAPLTGVSSLAQWILEDDASLSAASRERLGLIRGRIERMKRLLDDIRDYARAGRYSEPMGEALTAAALAAEVASTSYSRPGFSIECDPSLESVMVSRIPLEQVLHNLIGNAIKHHDRASGTVTVSVREGVAYHRFFIADDGPGIPTAYRETVFEMFKTLQPRDAVEGSGMGLALVKKIVGRMGGECGIEAAGARGAVLWFDWPRYDRSLRGVQ
ncbi:MAG: PAS domain S-box protein [Steroidobacteraceae bacterium]|jgi:PAS domain S-box-containing protein